MASPPNSPSGNLQGTSRTTGGIFRGRALGNVFNHADAFDILANDKVDQKGIVQVYASHTDSRPLMTMKHKMTPTLAPILKALSRHYSPISSKIFNIICLISTVMIFCPEFNQRVFVNEDDTWEVKGRYNTALEDDDDANWIFENDQNILKLLVVSILL